MAFGEILNREQYPSVNYLQDAVRSGQVQSALQNRFDVNSAKLEELVQKVSSIPILQEDAKRYLGEKIQGGLNLIQANLKASRGQGLLSNSVTTQLQGYITDAIDDKVKDHIRYSQQIQNFENGVAKLREKDPKSYNQANYDFAKYQAGYNEYLNGTVDTKLGSLQYTPYKDVWGDALKKAEDIKKMKGDQTIETLGSDGITKIKRELKGLTPEEIVRYMPELVDSQSEQQIMIDGWADMKHLKPEQVSEYFNTYINTKKNAYSEEINKIKDILKTDGGKLSANQREAYQQKLESYSSELSGVENKAKSIDPTKPEQVGYLLKKESLLNAMADAFTGRISETTDIDPVKKFEMEHQFAIDKFNKEYALDVEKLNLDKAKALKESGITKDANGNFVSDNTGGVWTDSEENQTVPDRDIVKQYEDTHTELYNKVYKDSRDIYNKLKVTTPSVKTDIEESMRRNGYILNKSGDDFIVDPTYKGKFHSKADSYAIALIDSEVAQKEGEFAPLVADILEANQMRGEYSSNLSKAYKAGKGNAVYTSKLSNPWAVAKAGVEPQYENVLVSGKPDDYNKMRSILEQSKVRPFVQDQKKFTFDGETHANILKSISPDNISGGVFDYKQPFQIKFDSNNNSYLITQIQEGSKPELQKTITATVKPNSSTAGMIQNIVSTQREKSKELSVKDVPNGYIIKSPITKSTLVDNDSSGLKGIRDAGIENTLKDTELVSGLKSMTLHSEAYNMLYNTLIYRGVDERTASDMSNKIIEGVENNTLQGTIQGSVNQWIFTVNKNGKTLNGYQVIGEGEFLNNDISKALRLYPSQTTLYQIQKYLSDFKYSTLEDISRINKFL